MGGLVVLYHKSKMMADAMLDFSMAAANNFGENGHMSTKLVGL